MATAGNRQPSNELDQYYKVLYKRLTETRIYRIMDALDRHIERNLAKDAIKTRPSSSNGLWCCFLLPTILVVYSIEHNVSLLYKILACLSMGLLCSSVLFTVFMSVSCSVLKRNVNAGWAASSLVSTLLMYGMLNQGLIISLVYSFISVYMLSAFMRICLTMCPKTFTVGEALVVVQAFILLCYGVFLRMFLRIGDYSDSQMNFIFDVNFTVLISVALIIASLCILDQDQRDIHTISYVGSAVAIFAVALLLIITKFTCLVQLVNYILNLKRIQLILFWLIMTVLAGVALYMRTRLNVKASTVTRKVFHVLASLVFLSGIVYDVHLMTLAAGVGFSALILVETFRKSNIPHISPALQAAFVVYSDEKDVGCFAMTPLYLYCGLACPLILVPIHKNYQLELLSGVLSIGIGDTAASWFGARYGFNKWADGHKSVEGTTFNILSQIGVVYALQFFDILSTDWGLLRTVIAAIVSGLVEAKTGQIDNLVVPLVTIIAFQISYIVIVIVK